MNHNQPQPVAGPLGNVVQLAEQGVNLASTPAGRGASALILLRRVAPSSGTEINKVLSGTRRWAVQTAFGEDHELLQAVVQRRQLACRKLREQGYTVAELRAEPTTRLAVGLSSGGIDDVLSLSLHGTYGVPILPASSLKGVASAWARDAKIDPSRQRESLGTHERIGGACFLDALPAAGTVRAEADVLTPHVGPYYKGYNAEPLGQFEEPPAEYWSPVPIEFLTLISAAFSVFLYGRDGAEVRRAADWLAKGLEDLGVGGKTAAGYGYMTCSAVSLPPEGKTP